MYAIELSQIMDTYRTREKYIDISIPLSYVFFLYSQKLVWMVKKLYIKLPLRTLRRPNKHLFFFFFCCYTLSLVTAPLEKDLRCIE